MNNLDKQYPKLFEDIETVKKALQNKFPNKPYTIRILLWDDSTSNIECTYGDGEKNYVFTFKDGVLSYNEIDTNGKVMVLNKFGEEEFYKLVK